MVLESSFIHVFKGPMLVIDQVSETTGYSFSKYLLSARTLCGMSIQLGQL